jgi:hypothetical protein
VSQDLFADASAGREFAEAMALLQGGDWRAALDRLFDLLRRRLLRRQPLAVGDRVLIERVADLAVPFGARDGADSLLAGLAGLNAGDGYHFAADYLTLKRAHLALMDEDLPRARERLAELQPRIGPLEDVPWREEDLPPWERRCDWLADRGPPADRALFFARFHLAAGQYLAAEGRHGHAVLLFARGAEHARSATTPAGQRTLTPLLLGLAGMMLDQGRLEEAEEQLTSLAGRIDPRRDVGWHVQRLERGARLHLLRGEYGPALSCLAGVNDACFQGGFARAALGALLNQTEVLILVNQVVVAEETLHEAELLAQALGDESAAKQIDWLRQLADARARSDVEGVAIAPSVTEMWRGRDGVEAPPPSVAGPPTDLPQPCHFLSFFDSRALGVAWALSRKEAGHAEALWASMKECFADCESPLITLRLHALAGMIAHDQGDFASADRIFSEVCPHLQQRGLRPELWQALRFRRWCGVRLGRPVPELNGLAAQAQSLVQDMAATLSPAERAVYLLNKWTVEEKALGADLDRLAALAAEANAARWYARPLKRWRLTRELHAFLHKLDANRRALARREVRGSDEQGSKEEPAEPLWRWLWSQPRDAATLSFLVLADRVFVSCSGWLSLDFAVRPVTRVALRELVKAWHKLAQVTESWHVPETKLDELAAAVGRELGLEAILERLPARVKRLVIVADDSLQGFPFAALRVGGRYLIERFALSLSYDRTATRRRCGGPLARAGARGLAVGVARGAPPLGIPDLPKVAEELPAVSEWLRPRVEGVRSLNEDAADLATMRDLLPQSDFVHFAGHGTFEPDAPDASGLLLVPRPGKTEMLTQRLLDGMDLRRVRHLTLSSCWGADSFVLPGRWIISLPQTLCRAGVGSVLSSLWPVNDELGLAFQKSLLGRLHALPRDQAVRAAQLECLAGKMHVLNWSGYLLHGDRGPLFE